MESMRSCLEAARHLDDCPVDPIKVSQMTSPDIIQETKDRHRLSRKHIAHMLNAVVLEIAIKVIWELDHDEECRHIHNIDTLYDELDEESRRELKEIYDEKSAALAGLEGTNKKGQRIRLEDLVQFQSLQDALVANEYTMKHFKYDGGFNGKSSAMGSVIWDKGTLWTIPPLDQMRFPEALYRYVDNRVQKAMKEREQ